MPVQGQQQPGFFLPGLEYASLSPNTYAALQGRRRGFNNSPLVSVPTGLDGQATAQIVLGTDFASGSGIYVVDAWALFTPADPTANLRITATVLRLIANAGALAYELGIPLATTLSPANAQPIARDQEKLITMEDLIGINATSGGSFPQTWTLQAIINVHNDDPTLTHNFVATVQAIWHRIDGILM